MRRSWLPLKTVRTRRGPQVGSWQVYKRSDDEIIFGDDMGFMEYRFSFYMDELGNVEAGTAVKFKWARLSRCYFGLVKPLHRRFVPLSLRAALRRSNIELVR